MIWQVFLVTFPAFHIPIVPLELETLYIIGPYAIILALIGLIESLLTLNLVGEITGKRGGASKECIAQGAAYCNRIFCGMGGCAMIGQSMINVKSEEDQGCLPLLQRFFYFFLYCMHIF